MDARVETKVVTAHVPKELTDKLDVWAARLERSRGWIMKQALSAWIDREEERHEGTLEGLADVNAGRFVEDSVVQEWVDSLGTDHEIRLPLLK